VIRLSAVSFQLSVVGCGRRFLYARTGCAGGCGPRRNLRRWDVL